MPVLPAKPFYLLRHGETVTNALGLMTGGSDPEVNGVGVAQAESTASWIGDITLKPSLIVRSDRSRTKFTAETINKNLNVPIHIEPALDEHNFGDWIGMPYEEAKKRTFINNETPPNGESFDVFTQRIQAIMTKILNTYNDPVLFVGHGGTFRAIAKMYNKPLWGSKNCQLHYFEPIQREDFPWQVTQFMSDKQTKVLEI
ncbi:MAG: histidine phosphatase family protein [Micavibrio sp.]|nr:histidine phosphatase family protein [Micavibrio sp.]|tara:strand:+ start:2635 stop:3234 length:600 start_codon:yes stop_codon:yes gene_type:complete